METHERRSTRTFYLYLAATGAAILLGAVLLLGGLLLRDLAYAEQAAATQRFDVSAAAFENATAFHYLKRIPGIGADLVDYVRVRRAALDYWQGHYALLISRLRQEGAMDNMSSENVDLQMLVANAGYRISQTEAQDPESVLKIVDEAINGYVVVLKNSPRREDAAFNVEFLYRLRNNMESSRDKAGIPQVKTSGPLGRVAGPYMPAKTKTEFKTLVPLEIHEMDKADAGKAKPAIRRKG
jgi:hypothetical protein